MLSASQMGLAFILGSRFKTRVGSGCVRAPVVPGFLETCKPWAMLVLGHFVQPLLLLLMEGPSTPFPGPLCMAVRQLHTWSACLDPLLCLGMSLGNAPTSFPH